MNAIYVIRTANLKKGTEKTIAFCKDKASAKNFVEGYLEAKSEKWRENHLIDYEYTYFGARPRPLKVKWPGVFEYQRDAD